MKRTPMKRGRGNPIPKASIEAVKKRSHDDCEARIRHVCTGQAEHIHHIVRRREGGHDPSNLLHCCGACHREIHAFPERARSVGFIGSAIGTTRHIYEPSGLYCRCGLPRANHVHGAQTA